MAEDTRNLIEELPNLTSSTTGVEKVRTTNLKSFNHVQTILRKFGNQAK